MERSTPLVDDLAVEALVLGILDGANQVRVAGLRMMTTATRAQQPLILVQVEDKGALVVVPLGLGGDDRANQAP